MTKKARRRWRQRGKQRARDRDRVMDALGKIGETERTGIWFDSHEDYLVRNVAGLIHSDSKAGRVTIYDLKVII